MYCGAHFLNDPYHSMSIEERSRFERRYHGTKHNAVLEGNFLVVATSEIRIDMEILLDYTPEKQTPDTATFLTNRDKARIAQFKNGNKRKASEKR